jgi:hypothetical protein
VVRIHWSYTNAAGQFVDSWCSGSLIGNGLVLTAGHCVYSNLRDGLNGPEHTGFINYYNLASYTVVPGEFGADDTTNIRSTPHGNFGAWTVKNMWTTGEYASTSNGGDWGLIELNPDANGNYPGQSAGTVQAIWDQPTIHELYSMGYPLGGAFEDDPATYGGGFFQYFCNTLWTNDIATNPDGSWDNYFALAVQPCGETAGASGGPVFTDTNNAGGAWKIVGVNNRAPAPDPATDLGTEMISFYLNDAFGGFYTDVINQINQGS